jgi:hypothetical protein
LRRSICGVDFAVDFVVDLWRGFRDRFAAWICGVDFAVDFAIGFAVDLRVDFAVDFAAA